MRVAIVGSGVSGLVCAHLLRRRHDVTLFEAADYLGGHTHTVEVREGHRTLAIDTGFIVFNRRTYPNFNRLLDELGVPSRPSEMSFSVSCEQTGLEYASRSLTAMLAQPSNLLRPRFHRMLRDIRRFNQEAPHLLAGEDEKVTLGDYLAAFRYSDDFVERYLVPLGASIWSASPSRFLAFPARALVAFFANHGLLDRRDAPRWRVIPGGSRRYVDALVSGLPGRIRLRYPVRSIRRFPERVELEMLDGGRIGCDRVVLATHSDQALSLLLDASPAERAILGALPYERNEVVLHCDTRMMPRRRRAWSSWNYRIPRAPQERVAVTYDMNRLQGLDSRRPYLVTLNQSDRIDPRRVLDRFVYHHPLYTAEGFRAQKLHAEIDGLRRTHFCGAYWGYGFHEDGVNSALRVSRALGVEP